MTEKAEQLKDSLKIAVKRRGNLRRMFTNEGKKLAPIFDKADKAEIADEDIEQLKAGQRSTRCEGYFESHEVQLSEGPVIRASENESGRYHGH